MTQDTRMPTLDLVRRLTDSHVLEQLLASRELTRAEIAARTGISKPTVSESVRRLSERGLLTESGVQTGRRGRTGTYYRLRDDAGVALALSAGPDGVVAQTCDLRGQPTARVDRTAGSPVDAATLSPVLSAVVREALTAAPGPVLGWSLSLAGPVDRRTGRLVHLPHSPFLTDELDPREVVGHLVGAPLLVDNDVNWAALAEHREGAARDLADFCFCYLGPGLGAALVVGGAVLHGARGLAGELAHVRTRGPAGRSLRLVECFAAWGLLRPGTDAIDVPRLAEVLLGGSAAERALREDMAVAVAGALCSVTALANPAGIVLGGPWSTLGGFDTLVAEHVHREAAVATEVRTSTVGPGAPLAGARTEAVRVARQALLGTG